MLCENCGENEANVRYTQIINGDKKEVMLCDKCAKSLGIEHMDFSMPINLSSFLGDFFNNVEEHFLLNGTEEHICNECGMTYDEFINTGKFGCANCYDAFCNKISPILKNIQGANKHIGRKTNITKQNLKNINEIKEDKKVVNKIDMLKEDLKKAIAEERYEDAAKIRDEIKKIE